MALLLGFSQFSFFQGVVAPGELVVAAGRVGYSEIALADLNSLHGLVEFAGAARQAGVRPLIGATVSVAGQGGLVLLLKRDRPLAPLVAAVNRAALGGEVPAELLTDGLLVLAGCHSRIRALLARGDLAGAARLAARLQQVLGEDFILTAEPDKALWPSLKALARQTGLAVAACPAVCWVEPQQELAWLALARIAPGRQGSSGGLVPPEQLARAYWEWPQAVATARRVAAAAGGQVSREIFLPRFGENDRELLQHLCRRGLERHYGSRDREAQQRLARELKVIEEMGFSSYFLIAWDLVRFARSQGIAVGPGRGSAGGSIVAYLLDITRVDPLEHNLYFERFLNPGRVTLPDIDIDLCYRRRDEVFCYAVERYGRDRTCQIATYATLGSRGSLRDAGRALGIPRREIDALCRRVPGRGRLAEIIPGDPELAARARRQPWQDWFALAAQLEGRVRHTSVHPGGLLITPFPLDQLVPLERATGGDICSQWDKDGVEAMGLLKMDLLAVRGLTINQQVVAAVGREEVARRYSHADPATTRLLQQGQTLGCFQLESEGMRALLRRLRPRGLEDVIAALSLYRPGPWQAGMVERYLRRRHGQEGVDCFHPALAPVLGDTYGVLLYQEQVMQVAQVIAGYSAAETDMLRRAVAKLKRQEMEELTRDFCRRAGTRGYPPDLARNLLKVLVDFSGYAFNRAHSAAYGHLAMATVFLKAHWPHLFFAALLATRMGYYPPQSYVNEASRWGIEVLPPCVNGSAISTQAEGKKAIRLGLDYVKGLGCQAEVLVASRQQAGPFRSPADLARRCRLGEKQLRNLVLAGALDCLEPNRRRLLAALPMLAAGTRADLFSGGQGEEVALPDLPDLSPGQKVGEQLAVLGLVTDRDWLEGQQVPWPVTRVRAADVVRLGNGCRVALAGAVVNRRYGNITLDDFSGQVVARYDGPIPGFWVWAAGRVRDGRLEEVTILPLEGVTSGEEVGTKGGGDSQV